MIFDGFFFLESSPGTDLARRPQVVITGLQYYSIYIYNQYLLRHWVSRTPEFLGLSVYKQPPFGKTPIPKM